MSISAKDVMALRARTNVSMMACKKALVEADGDMDAAIEILRKKGEAKAADKADRETTEGVAVVSGRHALALRCETDFVARNDEFIAAAREMVELYANEGKDALEAHWDANKTDLFTKMGENLQLTDMVALEGGDTVGSYVHSDNKHAAIVALNGGTPEVAKDIALHIVASRPTVLMPEDVEAGHIESEKDIWREQLLNEGKPENIVDNIIAGKEAKFRSEQALHTQGFVKNPDQSIADFAQANGATVVGFVHITV